MKKVKSFRLSSHIDEKLNLTAKAFNISTSQLIELACIKFLEKNNNIDNTKNILKNSKNNQLRLNLSLDNETFKKLINVVNEKNSTFSQEIYFRLSSSLNYPVFDTIEFNELWSLRTDLNRVGNLIKMAINQNIPFDNELLIKTENTVKSLRDEVKYMMEKSKKRTLKG